MFGSAPAWLWAAFIAIVILLFVYLRKTRS